MELNPEHCLNALLELTAGRKVCVAYSGGVDSHVLLHLLATTPHKNKPPIRAVYVHHGLQTEADQWARHCAQTAQQLAIPFQTLHISVNHINEHGMESAARQARYQALADNLDADEVLLTAHHQQDQAETLLLQLFRGAGPAGIAAMSTLVSLWGMTVIRPLLTTSKQTIMTYARNQQLSWIDDPSNTDTQIYRNYLREHIWPLLSQRWPAIETTLSRSAAHCQDSVQLMQDMAQLDARQVCPDSWQALYLPALRQLPLYRQRNLLRFALEQSGLSLPSSVILDTLLHTISHAAIDATPLISWGNVQARRYQQTLYLLTAENVSDTLLPFTLNSTSTMALNQTHQLLWQQEKGQGLRLSVIEAGLTVKYRQGGERILLVRQAHHKTLKQLFQEWKVPPWQRDRVPLLFAGDELVAVVGYGYAKAYAVTDADVGWVAVIQSPDSARF